MRIISIRIIKRRPAKPDVFSKGKKKASARAWRRLLEPPLKYRVNTSDKVAKLTAVSASNEIIELSSIASNKVIAKKLIAAILVPEVGSKFSAFVLVVVRYSAMTNINTSKKIRLSVGESSDLDVLRF
jgi:hypothetical protein